MWGSEQHEGRDENRTGVVGEWSRIEDEVGVRVGVGNGTGVEVWKMFGEEEGGGDGLILSNHPPSCTHSGYRVYLGKHALGRAEAGEQVREVVCSIPHPQYQISSTHLNHDHDIMLLELQSPVQPTNHIRVLPLSHNDGLPAGTCCRVSGWGTTTSPQGRHPHRWPDVCDWENWGRNGREGGRRIPLYIYK